MSVLTTLIQHSVGNFSQCNKTRKGNKRHTDSKEKLIHKLSLLAEDMSIYLEIPKESTKTLLELLSRFSKGIYYVR